VASPPPLFRLPRPADPEAATRNRERWLEAADEWDDKSLIAFARTTAKDAKYRALLDAVFGNSPFLSHCLITETATFRAFLKDGPDTAFADILAALRTGDADDDGEAALMRRLRVGKRRASLLIALADITGRWNLDQVTGALSRVAETATSVACVHLLHQAEADGEIKLPHPEEPEWDSGLVVLGMGKLGADELNYSSDVDLIVLYDDEKVDYRGARSKQKLFVTLAQDLVRFLEERTADGYVFRCDLRLRPDPASTPLAISVLAAETYYESLGQNWERAAMIKARAIAGDRTAGEAYLRELRPFIWRKNLDFAAIQDIHSIKRQIDAHKGGGRIAVAGHDIKLGRGGIREIEFFVQTQQLIRGGRDPNLRTGRTLDGLQVLAKAGLISQTAADEMAAAYRFLRMVEHRLQMVDDRQTQRLPEEPEALTAIARFSGFDTLDAFDQAMRETLRTVERHYAKLFEDAPQLAPQGNLVFTGTDDDPETVKTITALGFRDPSHICGRIRGWHHGQIAATRSTRARETLTEITPALLAALAKTADPDAAFVRFDTFVSALPTGVQLFALLFANPGLLDLVAELMGDAPRLAELLGRRPALLDAVLTGAFFAPLPPLKDLVADLEGAIAHENSRRGGAGSSADEDLEAVMDMARRWGAEQKFRVGVQLLRNMLTPEQAAAQLSDVADAAVACLVPHEEADFARNHGRMPGRGTALVAMGKLGSQEMTANSDLDLLLIYDMTTTTAVSDGKRPLPAETYFGRLTQRLIAGFTARTAEGTLYDVDMRLRPSGSKGPIATSLEAFKLYHREEAWTWEHMALTRARVIAGSPAMRTAVRRAIRDTLTKPRDPEKLRADVADMRLRMAAELKSSSPWEVKHRRGGLVDIEFVAQYLQLRWAAKHPSILKLNTAAVLIEARELGLLDAKDAKDLLAALHLWTAIQQVLRMTVEGEFDQPSLPGRLGQALAKAAGCAGIAALQRAMDAQAKAAHAIYERLLAPPKARGKTPAKRPAKRKRGMR
jgi:glutamate-ammonia-ligase adenylyltransferase